MEGRICFTWTVQEPFSENPPHSPTSHSMSFPWAVSLNHACLRAPQAIAPGTHLPGLLSPTPWPLPEVLFWFLLSLQGLSRLEAEPSSLGVQVLPCLLHASGH